jgi:hypothetical protein
MPCSGPTRRHSPATHRLTLVVQRAGCLLCWNLAAAMTTAAFVLLLDTRAAWWRTLWPLP